MEWIAHALRATVNWLGVPEDITPWELLNSELITAAIIGAIGLFLNRKVNRLSERAEDTATVAAYERELADIAGSESSGTQLAGPEPTRRSGPVEDFSDGLASSSDLSMDDILNTLPPEEIPPFGAPLEEFEEVPPIVKAPVPGRKIRPPEPPGAESGNPLQSEASHIVNEAKRFVDGRLEKQLDGRKKRKYENIGKRDYRMRVLAARDDKLISDTQAVDLLGIFETWRPYGTGRRAVEADILDSLRNLMSEVLSEAPVIQRQRREKRKTEADLH